MWCMCVCAFACAGACVRVYMRICVCVYNVLIKIFQQGLPLLMVQELVPLGSMLSYLLQFPEQVNPNYELKVWAAQIACGKKLFIYNN